MYITILPFRGFSSSYCDDHLAEFSEQNLVLDRLNHSADIGWTSLCSLDWCPGYAKWVFFKLNFCVIDWSLFRMSHMGFFCVHFRLVSVQDVPCGVFVLVLSGLVSVQHVPHGFCLFVLDRCLSRMLHVMFLCVLDLCQSRLSHVVFLCVLDWCLCRMSLMCFFSFSIPVVSGMQWNASRFYSSLCLLAWHAQHPYDVEVKKV